MVAYAQVAVAMRFHSIQRFGVGNNLSNISNQCLVYFLNNET